MGKVYIFHNDVHKGDSGNNILRGWHNEGESFHGEGGNDELYGGGGNDDQHGDEGNDKLVGGNGNDELHGDGGSDTYVFRNGDGNDTIYEINNDTDTIYFDQNFQGNTYKCSRNGNNLVIDYGAVSSSLINKITVKDYFTNNTIEYIEFKCGKKITLSTIKNNETWSFDSFSNAYFHWYGDDLEIWDDGFFVIKNFFGTNEKAATHIKVGSTIKSVVDFTEAKNRQDATSYYYYELSGFFKNGQLVSSNEKVNIIGSNQGETIEGDAGANIIYALKGNDILKGASGHDTYVFRVGDGQDVIRDESGIDSIQFLQDFKNNSYTFERSGNDLIIYYGTNDQIKIEDQFNSKVLDYIKFNDNIQIDISWAGGLQENTWHTSAFSSNATFQKKDNNLIISDGGGHFILKNAFDITKSQICTQLNLKVGTITSIQKLSDIRMVLNQGNNLRGLIDGTYQLSDFLQKKLLVYQEDGQKKIIGTDGTETIEGDAGANTIYGLKGNDTLKGGTGNDKYVFRNGDGLDTIEDGSGWDTISFDQTFENNTYQFERSGNDFVIHYGKGDKITYKDYWNGNCFDYINFQGGKQINITEGNQGAGSPWLLPFSANATFQKDDNNLIISDGGGKLILKNVFDATQLQVCTQLKLGDQTKNISDITSALVQANGLTKADYLYQLGDFLNKSLLIYKNNNHKERIIGSTSHDTLEGDAGANTIYGLKGNETLKGAAGNDTYVFHNDDGKDVITDEAGIDSIQFLQDFKNNSYTFERLVNDLIIYYGTNDQIKIEDQFNDQVLDYIKFNDNVQIDISRAGGLPQDTWKVAFSANTTFQKEGNNLIISDGGGKFILKNAFDHSQPQVCTQLKLGQQTKAISDIVLALNAAKPLLEDRDIEYQLADFFNNSLLIHKNDGRKEYIIGHKSHDTLEGDDGANTIYGQEGSDKLDGKKGNDTLKGGKGEDIYLFRSGDGQDVIEDDSNANDLDVIEFVNQGTNIPSEDIKNLARVENNLVITHGTGNDTITVNNYFTTDPKRMRIKTSSSMRYNMWDLVRQAEDLNKAKNEPLNNWSYSFVNLTANLWSSQQVVYDPNQSLNSGETLNIVKTDSGDIVNVVDTIDCSKYVIPNSNDSNDGLWIKVAEKLAHFTRKNSNEAEMTESTIRILQGIKHVIGTSKNDILEGDREANTLSGRGGNDVFSGRQGNDTLIDGIMHCAGSGGNSTYRFMGEDGHDEIYDWGGEDTILIMDSPDTFSRVSFTRDQDDLKIGYNFDTSDAGKDTIRIHDHFKKGRGVEKFIWGTDSFDLTKLSKELFNSTADSYSSVYLNSYKIT